jgi:hypothetical protein
VQILPVFYLHKVVKVLLLCFEEDIIFGLPPAFLGARLRGSHIMVTLLGCELNLRFGLDDLAHSLRIFHYDEVVDCADSVVEALKVALIIQVHVHQQQAGIHGVWRSQNEFDLEVIERNQSRHSLRPKLLAEALHFPQGDPEYLVEAGAQGVNGEEVLVLRVLLLEVVADSHQLHVPLVEPQQLLLQLVRPNSVQLEALALETAASLELLVAAHSVVHPLELHLRHPRFQRLLDADVEANGCVLGDGYAADAIDYLHELEVSAAVLGLEVTPAVE